MLFRMIPPTGSIDRVQKGREGDRERARVTEQGLTTCHQSR